MNISIYLSTETHVCYNSLANGYVAYSIRRIKMLIVTFLVTFAVLLFKNTVNSTVSGYGQFKVTFRNTYLFFPNDKVFRYFDYPVIFHSLLAASI